MLSGIAPISRTRFQDLESVNDGRRYLRCIVLNVDCIETVTRRMLLSTLLAEVKHTLWATVDERHREAENTAEAPNITFPTYSAQGTFWSKISHFSSTIFSRRCVEGSGTLHPSKKRQVKSPIDPRIFFRTPALYSRQAEVSDAPPFRGSIGVKNQNLMRLEINMIACEALKGLLVLKLVMKKGQCTSQSDHSAIKVPFCCISDGSRMASSPEPLRYSQRLQEANGKNKLYVFPYCRPATATVIGSFRIGRSMICCKILCSWMNACSLCTLKSFRARSRRCMLADRPRSDIKWCRSILTL